MKLSTAFYAAYKVAESSLGRQAGEDLVLEVINGLATTRKAFNLTDKNAETSAITSEYFTKLAEFDMHGVDYVIERLPALYKVLVEAYAAYFIFNEEVKAVDHAFNTHTFPLSAALPEFDKQEVIMLALQMLQGYFETTCGLKDIPWEP